MKNEHEIKRTQEHVTGQNFYKFAKDSILSNIQEHPHTNYLKNCNRDAVPAFPLFQKVSRGNLVLYGYHLNLGMCKALRSYLEDSNSQTTIISNLMLHSNGCSDESFATLLKSVGKQSRLKHLHYSANDFAEKSTEALIEILDIQPPHHLTSLCLCRPKKFTLINQLAEGLLRTDNLLKLVL